MNIEEILNNREFPYKKVLDDMGVESMEARYEFLDSAQLFANNCYKAAISNNYPLGTPIQGLFHWRTQNPSKFFRVHFTYYHSEELIFVINGFDKLSLEEYMDSLNQEMPNHTKIVNTDSELVKSIMNKNNN